MNLPLAGYGRVSRVGERDKDRLISPDQQRQAVESKAREVGREVVWYGVDLDVSGAKAKRKILDQILADMEAGTIGGMIVSKLNRFSRLKPRDRLDLLDRLEDAGAILLSAAENIDPRTPEGRFARDVFFGIARMEWERYKEGFDNAKEGAMARGIPVGPTHFWLRRLPTGRVELHPERSAALRHVMLGVIPDDGLSAGVAYMNDQDFRHEGKGKRKGKPYVWTTSTLRRTISNPALMGTARYGELTTEIPALVSRREWLQSQLDPAEARRPPALFPLSGLATCATCGTHMVGARGGPDARRMYRCAAGLNSYRGDRCPSPATISAHIVEDYARAWIVDALEANPINLTAEDDSEEIADVEKRIGDLDAELTELTDDIALRRSIGAERFRKMTEAVSGQLEEAVRLLNDLVRQQERKDAPIPSADAVRQADLEALGGYFRAVFASVIVKRGRVSVAARVRFVQHAEPDAAMEA